ncbi:MAG: hypothetical protein A2202_08870 [Bdellovibrionales bacterium RIFOXYA1_FULL_36_14]|nr:MAG: hypothetical protein A2202_08870 [Bdellovibrionales bacterium RIFOXYA1_FULL_36_14]
MKKVLSTIFLTMAIFIPEINANQTIDASILKLDYLRPSNFSGPAGSVIFDEVKILRNDMMMILENDDDVFDSEIFIRNKFLGFKGKYHSFGFIVDSESMLGEVNEANLSNALLNIDDQRLNFSADQMKLDILKAALEFNNSRLFCLKDQLLVVESDNLLFGCLNNANFAPNTQKTDALVKIEVRGDDASQNIFLEGLLESFEMTADSIVLKTQSSNIKLVDKEISTDEFQFICPKSYIVPPFDSQKIVTECFDNARMVNEEKQSVGLRFKLKVEEDELDFNSRLKSVSMDKLLLRVLSIDNEFKFDAMTGKSDAVTLDCNKYLNLSGEIFPEFMKACANNLHLAKNVWAFQDTEFDMRYFFNLNQAVTSADKINITLTSFQKVNSKNYPNAEIEKGTLTAFGIHADCRNDNSLDQLALSKFFNNCFKSGKITVDSVVDSKQKDLVKIYKSYDGVMENFDQFASFDPVSLVKDQRAIAKNVLITFNNNVVTLTSKFYFMMGYKDIMLSGPIKFDEATSEIEMEIKKVKLPVPFVGRSTWFASKMLKKFLSSGTIRVVKKKIYIKIGRL